MPDAIVLGGGGSLGAFNVGVVRWLLIDKGIAPAVVTGTSTGALGAVLTATGEIGLLSDIYTNVTTRDVLHRSFLGDVNLVLHGFVNSVDPLRDLIDTYFTPARRQKIIDDGVELRIAATNLQTGAVENASQNDSLDHLKAFVLASSCQPALMPTIRIGSDDYLDGGIMQMLPVQAALDAGATKIYASAVTATPANRPPLTRQFPNAPGTDVLNFTLRRAVLLRAAQQTDDTIALLQERGVDITVFQPASSLAPDPLTFNPAEMSAMVDEGYLRAQAILP